MKTMPAIGRAAAAPLDVFRFLLAGRGGGRARTLLATIVGLTGTGARAVGTHMAVLDDGDQRRPFSSGCVEAAIVAEALAASRAGTAAAPSGSATVTLYRHPLPCGGGMDVLFIPDPDGEVLAGPARRLDRRVAVRPGPWAEDATALVLAIGAEPRASAAAFASATCRRCSLFVAGHGAEAGAPSLPRPSPMARRSRSSRPTRIW